MIGSILLCVSGHNIFAADNLKDMMRYDLENTVNQNIAEESTPEGQEKIKAELDQMNKEIEAAREAEAKAAREAAQRELGIVMNTECMTSVGCSMDVGVMLGLKDPAPAGSEAANRTSVLTFVQDIVLAATFFIGTVVTLALIFSGLLFIFSAADSSKKKIAIS
ncbi:MAG: hypothetical protein LBG59_02095 [Candidatus Peribacteria bacterium]|nr:hypothetical protein [Candidatus Peribacteria bacterium]